MGRAVFKCTYFGKAYSGAHIRCGDAFFPICYLDYAPDCDVLFSPNINLVRTKAPRVVVVHDLSFVRYPEFLSPLQRYWHWLMVPKKQAKAAEAIVVPSFATKQDMVRLWGI